MMTSIRKIVKSIFGKREMELDPLDENIEEFRSQLIGMSNDHKNAGACLEIMTFSSYVKEIGVKSIQEYLSISLEEDLFPWEEKLKRVVLNIGEHYFDNFDPNDSIKMDIIMDKIHIKLNEPYFKLFKWDYSLKMNVLYALSTRKKLIKEHYTTIFDTLLKEPFPTFKIEGWKIGGVELLHELLSKFPDLMFSNISRIFNRSDLKDEEIANFLIWFLETSLFCPHTGAAMNSIPDKSGYGFKMNDQFKAILRTKPINQFAIGDWQNKISYCVNKVDTNELIQVIEQMELKVFIQFRTKNRLSISSILNKE
jgi:hypothetical protein